MFLAIFNISADAAAVVVGAGGAAILAAATAQWRLRVQLDHDTRLREREATREAINRVVDEIDAATRPMNAAGEASRELTTFRLGEIFETEERGAEDAANDLGAAILNLRERRVPLMTASFRLHVRLPDSDPIISKIAQWRETFVQLAEDYQAVLVSDHSTASEQFKTATETARRLGRELNEFLAEARAWSGDPSR